ncbi:MAG TPA: hypothetical protein VNU47_03375 [Candidatus Paceibacterota bacterium]|nr:hypothetical protein [Candidatus Paceibacterota bacterium]
MVPFESLGRLRVPAHPEEKPVRDFLIRSDVNIVEIAARLQETTEVATEVGVPKGAVGFYTSKVPLDEPMWDQLAQYSGLTAYLYWFHLAEILRVGAAAPTFKNLVPTGTQIAFRTNLADGLRTVRGRIDWQKGHSLGRVPLDRPWVWEPRTVFLVSKPS